MGAGRRTSRSSRLPGLLATPEVDRHARLIEAARLEYDTLCRQFAEKARSCGYERATRYYWYHTVDLGHGLVTPGDYDYRDTIQQFPFPANMSGMTVLDVGSATGFFAFEFERRGAAVTSVELPSISHWDMAFADRDRTLAAIKDWAGTDDLAAVDEMLVHGGFDFCREMLGSTVKRCLSSVYNLTPDKLGADSFDLVFVGDLLIHTMAPLKALNVLASLCRKTMVISQDLPDVGGIRRSWSTTAVIGLRPIRVPGGTQTRPVGLTCSRDSGSRMCE